MSRERVSVESLIAQRQSLVGTVNNLETKLPRVQATVREKILPQLQGPFGTTRTTDKINVTLRVGRARRGLGLFEKKVDEQRTQLAKVTEEIAARPGEYTSLVSLRGKQLGQLSDLASQGYLSNDEVADARAEYQKFIFLPDEIPALREGIAQIQETASKPGDLREETSVQGDEPVPNLVETEVVQAKPEDTYILPDGREIKGRLGQLLLLLPVLPDEPTEDTLEKIPDTNTLIAALYPGVDRKKARDSLSVALSNARRVLIETDLKIVNITQRGRSDPGRYYLGVSPQAAEGANDTSSDIAPQKDRSIQQAHLDAVRAYLDGRLSDDIFHALQSSGARGVRNLGEAGDVVARAIGRLMTRREDGTLTPDEAAVLAQIPASRIADAHRRIFFDGIHEAFRPEGEAPDVIELPEGIRLTDREIQVFELLQGASAQRIRTPGEVASFLGVSKEDVPTIISRLRGKLKAHGIVIPLADELSVEEDRVGYRLARANPHVEVVPVANDNGVELPELPESPAEFGTLSKVDVGVVASALKTNREFLAQVVKIGSDVSLLEEGMLNALSDRYGETGVDFSKFDKQQRQRLITRMRQEAFDKVKGLVGSADSFEEIKTKDPHVAALLTNLSAMQEVEVEIARNGDEPRWVQGMDAFRVLVTEPEVLRAGVRVKDVTGEPVAQVVVRPQAIEHRHMHVDTVVVTPLNDSLSHLVALAQGEQAEKEPKYHVPLTEGDELTFRGQAAQVLELLDREPPSYVNSGTIGEATGLGNRANVKVFIDTINSDLAGTGFTIRSRRGSHGGYALIKPSGEVSEKGEDGSAVVITTVLEPGVPVSVGEQRENRKSKERVLTTDLRETIADFLNELGRTRDLRRGATATTLSSLLGSKLTGFDFDKAKRQEIISGKPQEDTKYPVEDIAAILCLVRFGSRLTPQQKSELPSLIRQIQQEREENS